MTTEQREQVRNEQIQPYQTFNDGFEDCVNDLFEEATDKMKAANNKEDAIQISKSLRHALINLVTVNHSSLIDLAVSADQ